MATLLYKKMLALWGREAQVLKTCEEMGELQQALVKQVQKGRWQARVTEEIADVELMLGQMKYTFGIKAKDIQEKKLKKIKRIKARLAKKEKRNG